MAIASRISIGPLMARTASPPRAIASLLAEVKQPQSPVVSIVVRDPTQKFVPRRSSQPASRRLGPPHRSMLLDWSTAAHPSSE